MSLYTLAIYAHRIGALGFFITLGLEWFNIWQLRHMVSVGSAQKWFRRTGRARGWEMLFMAILLLSGLTMMAIAWGPIPWILVALGTLLLLAFVSAKFTGKQLSAMQPALMMGDAQISEDLPGSLDTAVLVRPTLWASVQTRVALTMGIVVLMISKPGLAEALLVILIALVIGLVASLPRLHQARTQRKVV